MKMAPTKPFRTYSRGKKSSVNSVEAFDLLFTKNLAQRKLANWKTTKYKVKCLPDKVKSVLKEESSIHVNFNDTFDRIRKPLNKLKQDSSGLQKLPSCSNKTTENSSWDSWFKRHTPSGTAITDSLEIEYVGRTRNFQQNLSRSSPIVLRSHTHSKLNKISLENLSRSKSKNSEQISINIHCSSLSRNNNVHLLSPKRQNHPLGSSTPFQSKKHDFLEQTTSRITVKDKDLRKSIVESISEIKEWSSIAPKFFAAPENPPKPKEIVHKEISFNLADFEDFLMQLSMSSDEEEQSSKSHGLIRQLTSFPKQQPKSLSLTTGESSGETVENRFVHTRRNRALARKRHISRSRESVDNVVLLVSFDESKLKSEDSSDGCLAAESNNKQLVVNLTRQSLDTLKTQLNPALSLLTPKACRKFSSNWQSSSPIPCSGSNQTSHAMESFDSLLVTEKEQDDKPSR